MPAVRHCRHCWGDCDGTCLLPGDTGLCIHKTAPRRSFRERVVLLGYRRFWRRVFWGIRA
jgi:hypothetical protein